MPSFHLLSILALVLSSGNFEIAAPARHLYLFELREDPVGTVELLVGPGGAYRYRSTQLFRAKGDRKVATFERRYRLRAGQDANERVPESLWLLHRPRARSCTEGFEERSGMHGRLCAQSITGSRVIGTVFGRPFRATYSKAGLLEELSLEHAHFRHVPAAPALTGTDLLEDGVALPGGEGRLAVEPEVRARAPVLDPVPVELLGALSEEMKETEIENAPPGECLALARALAGRFAAEGLRVGIVHGLLLEGGKAYPHAWVRARVPTGQLFDMDLSRDEAVSEVTHLPLAVFSAEDEQGAGELWLSLLAGKLRLVRANRPPRKE